MVYTTQFNMSDLIQTEIYYLLTLWSPRNSRSQKQGLIDTIGKQQLNALSEIALNILRGNVDLHIQYKPRLKRHVHSIRILASKTACIKDKKAVLSVPMVTVLLKSVALFLQHQAYSREHSKKYNTQEESYRQP